MSFVLYIQEIPGYRSRGSNYGGEGQRGGWILLLLKVWHDLLTKIHHVSKLLQSETMQIDVVVNLLRKIEASLISYRATGFASAKVSAKEMCEKMNVETVL